MLLLGVDLAWADHGPGGKSNETGVVALRPDGRVVDAGWTRGTTETLAWVTGFKAEDCLAAVDAPLVVVNATGQRACERHVGQRYGKWKVSARSTNLSRPHLAGVALREALERSGWVYSDGFGGAPKAGRSLIEVYPYTALVGAEELGYDRERPLYKRKPRALPTEEWRPLRAERCDDLISRLAELATADPPLDLSSHPITRALVTEPSPAADVPYKHREDLLDAALCAWTAALWWRHGEARCQVLGEADSPPPRPTIICPARPGQRLRASG